jgi:WD40 repeat protein
VAFGRLPDGRTLLASSSDDWTVRLWDPATGSPIGKLIGHTNEVTGVAFGRLPDSRTLLASSSHDETVRLWDPATGSPIGDPLTGHTRGVLGVAFGRLPDGRTLLASSSRDKTVRLEMFEADGSRWSTEYVLAPSTAESLIIAEDTIFVAASDGVIALAIPTRPT